MKVYPYHTPDGIIELVEKQELDEMTFLAQDLASQISDLGVLVDKLERELREEQGLELQEIDGKLYGVPAPKQKLQDALKRMEAVTQEELVSAYWGGKVATNSVVGANRIRDLLIKAAKGKA